MSATTAPDGGLLRFIANSRVRQASLIALAASLVLVVVTLGAGPLKDDIAWLLYVAHKWLHGSRLYVDVVEVNPPLIIWLYAIPQGLAELLSVQAKLTVIPFFCAIVLLCSGWAAAILSARRSAQPEDPVVLFAICASLLLLIPGGEFGQREHLMTAAVLPYLAVITRELDGDPPRRRTAALAAFLAALGCVLKPHYAIAIGLVEAYAMLRGLRLLRLSLLVGAGTFAAYGVAIYVLEPAYFRAAIPMAFALYGASDAPFLDLLFDCWLLLFAVAVGMLLLATEPGGDRRDTLPAVLLVFATGAAFVCVIQGKNWFYHRIPATVTAILSLTAWARLRLRGHWRPGWRATGPVVLAGVALGFFISGAVERLENAVSRAIANRESVIARLEVLIQREHAHSYVAFSDWIGLGFPVVNDTGVAWASRFDSTWALDGEAWRAKLDGKAPADFPVGRWMSADFFQFCPDIVVVDRRQPLDYLALLEHADPAFKQVWRNYERIASFGGLVVFRHKPSRQVHATGGCGVHAPPVRG